MTTRSESVTRNGDSTSPNGEPPRPNGEPPRPNGEPPRPNGEGKKTHRHGAFSSPRERRDVTMTRALRASHGVISLTRLRQLGLSRRDVDGLVRHGDLRRVHRGVYVDGRAPISDRGRLLAALLAVGHGSWISGRAAAAHWGLIAAVPATIDVTLVADHTPRHNGLHVSRRAAAPYRSEVSIRDGLRVSSIPQMLVEVAASGGTLAELRMLIEAAVRRNILDVSELAAALDRHSGRRGVGRLKQACDDYLPRHSRRSGLERSFDRWLARHPEIPVPQRNVHLGPWELDCYWPDQRLVLELDGRAYHTVVEEIERDRRKDSWLQVHGLRILRITDARWRRDKLGAYDDLTMMLALHERGAAA